MGRSRVHDNSRVKLENTLKEGRIPFRAGRPARDIVIGKEDMINLCIALNTARTLDDFLALV